MKEKILEYFTFTRKERLGVVVLLVIILALFIVPYWIRRPPGTEDPEATRQFAPLIEKVSRDNPDNENRNEKFSKSFVPESEDREKSGPKQRLAARPFYFDPNKIGENDWQRLGLSERQSRTLLHYTQKGGKFRTPADLEKIYGLSVEDRNRLMPYVRIQATDKPRYYPDAAAQTSSMTASAAWANYPGSNKKKYLTPEHHGYKTDAAEPGSGESPTSRMLYPKKIAANIDINRADSTAWEQLPGIGEKLAARIIRFREKLGGFYSVDQVGETFGLPDSVFQKIKPWLQAGSSQVQRIDLNTVSGETLRQHPYIRWKLANVLMRYRDQHGKFESVEELGQLALLDAATLEKLKPYLEIH